MSWELYEVWQEDEDGHEQLIDTTKSLKEARDLSKKSLEDANGTVYIYRETEDGDQEEIERLTVDENGAIITI
jgi:hypothetical protein